MKKYLSLFIIISLCFLVAACNNGNITDDISSSESGESTHLNIEKTTKTNETIKSSEQGGADLLPRKYRNNYYSIPASFIKIVGKPAFEEWEDVYLSENYPDNSNEMVMVAYVKAFNIPKEEFDRANLNYARFIDKHYSHICLNPQDYADQELQEIYNSDVIYTLDNDIINNYYLGIDYPFLNEYQYDEAIENGTYETRTTEFVTVEQMEAAIIAKYGEAEIVTESTTAEQTQTTTVEQPEITVG